MRVTDCPSTERADEQLQRYFAAPFDPLGRLPVALHLLRLPGHDRLLVRLNHLLVDAGGAKLVLYRLAEAFRELARDPHWSAPVCRRRHPLPRLIGGLRPWHAWRYLDGLLADLGSLTLRVHNAPRMLVAQGTGPGWAGASRFVPLRLDVGRVAQLADGQGMQVSP